MSQHTDPKQQTHEDVRHDSMNRGKSLNLNRVLVPLNGSQYSEQILPFASMFAEWFSGEITLFHSLPPTHPARGARPRQVHYPDAPHDRGTILASAYLEEVVSRLGPHGVSCRWGIATGDSATMITSRATTSSFGIIAIAASARSRVHRLASPGLLDKLWKTTTAPLLIVNTHHKHSISDAPKAPKTLIIPRGHSSSDSVLPIASAVAGASRSSIKIIEKKSTPGKKNESEIINYFSKKGIDAEIVRVDGNFTHQIHKIQADDHGSWILIGSKMRSGFQRSILGSVADRLVRDAGGPIVVVADSEVMEQRTHASHQTTRALTSVH
jgi:nucleotide-binding universal stress UspA family protein